MSYKQLTFIKRCRILALWEAGASQTEIAEKIGVHKSTISREFKRNLFWWNSRIPQYKPSMHKRMLKGVTNKKLRNLNSMKKLKHL